MPVSAGRLSWLGAPTGMIPLRFCRHSSHFGLRIVVRLVFMRHISPPLLLAALAGCLGLALGVASAASREGNPVRSHPVEIGPQASRLVVGFRATAGNSVVKEIKSRRPQAIYVAQAQTSRADVASLLQRTGIATT